MTTDDTTPTPMTADQAQAITRPVSTRPGTGFDADRRLRQIVGTPGIVLGILVHDRGVSIVEGIESLKLKATETLKANLSARAAIIDLALAYGRHQEPEFVDLKLMDARIVARVVSPPGRNPVNVLVLASPIGHHVAKSLLRVFRRFAIGLEKSVG